jgi:uncharacterized phage infection (PIP) family protein YhgE
MADHATVLANLIKAEGVIHAMGKPGEGLMACVRTIAGNMKKAGELRGPILKTQKEIDGKKKEAADWKTKLDAADAAHETKMKDYADDAKALGELTRKIQGHPGWDDKKQKATADNIADIRLWALKVERIKISDTDSDSYKTMIDQIPAFKRAIPKKDTGTPFFPNESDSLNDLLDKLDKKLNAAMEATKGTDKIRHAFVLANKSVDDLTAKLKPARDALGKLVAAVATDLPKAKDLDLQVEVDVGTPESVRIVAAVAKVLNDAIENYAGGDLDKWLARP